MRILFHDAASSIAYDARLMRSRSLGGTESTVVRVARASNVVAEWCRLIEGAQA